MEERFPRQGRGDSPTTVPQVLASVQINRLRIQSTGQTRLTLTEPSDLQRTYVTALDWAAILDDSTVRSVVEAMPTWL